MGLAAATAAILVSDALAVILIGTASMVVAAVLHMLHARYAYFATFLTAAIVLLNAERGNVFDVDVQRVLATIVGVLMVGAVVEAAEALFGRYRPN